MIEKTKISQRRRARIVSAGHMQSVNQSINIMATYQILYWKDIPAQVKVFRGRRPVSRLMPDWFQQEIDQVAMKEGLAGTDAYLDQWQWTEKRERDGEVEEVVVALLRELEAEYGER